MRIGSINRRACSNKVQKKSAGGKSDRLLERAARLKVERLAKTRHARLLRRLGNLPPGRGKRKEAIQRVERAAVFLLQGERLDTAAAMAGFKTKGDRKTGGAGDRLLEAAKRIGLIGGGFAIRRANRH